jgi:hypothetical protein
VYLPVAPTPDALDRVQFYYGARAPLPEDTVLSELQFVRAWGTGKEDGDG